MGNRKRFPDPHTDDELLADDRKMALLAAIDRGEVVRGADGEATSVNAMHFWNGSPIRFAVGRLRDDELVRMPISGPPVIDVRGRQLLNRLARRSAPYSPWFDENDPW